MLILTRSPNSASLWDASSESPVASYEPASSCLAATHGSRIFVAHPNAVDIYDTQQPTVKARPPAAARPHRPPALPGVLAAYTALRPAAEAVTVSTMAAAAAVSAAGSLPEPGVVFLHASPGGSFLVTCQKPQKNVETGAPMKNIK
ncbi:hypothetical protein QJQ45_029702, partial [Haematococcus lacustris]